MKMINALKNEADCMKPNRQRNTKHQSLPKEVKSHYTLQTFIQYTHEELKKPKNILFLFILGHHCDNTSMQFTFFSPFFLCTFLHSTRTNVSVLGTRYTLPNGCIWRGFYSPFAMSYKSSWIHSVEC